MSNLNHLKFLSRILNYVVLLVYKILELQANFVLSKIKILLQENKM